MMDAAVKALGKVLKYCWEKRHDARTTDLTFICRREVVRAHRFIVAIGNKWLHELLMEFDEDGNAVIHLPDVTSEALIEALKLLYLNFEAERLNEILTGSIRDMVTLTLHDSYQEDDDDEPGNEAPESTLLGVKRYPLEHLMHPKVKLTKLTIPPYKRTMTHRRKESVIRIENANDNCQSNLDDIMDVHDVKNDSDSDSCSSIFSYEDFSGVYDGNQDFDPKLDDTLSNSDVEKNSDQASSNGSNFDEEFPEGTCCICKQNFKDKATVIQHKKMEHGYCFYSCEPCKFRDRYKKNMIEHKRKCLPQGLPNKLERRCVNCAFCKEEGVISSFKDLKALKAHLTSDHSQALINLETCSFKDCKETENLLQHVVKKHHFFVYYCPICTGTEREKSYKPIQLFDHHWDTEHLGRRYQCLVCNKTNPITYNERYKLERHLFIYHKCKVEEFDDEAVLKEVVSAAKIDSTATENEDEKIDCKKGEVSLDIEKLRVNGRTMFKCNFCEELTKSEKIMMKHRLQCMEMNKLRMTKSVQHWPCGYCSEHFTSKVFLMRHKRTAHCAEFYVCTTCPEKLEFYSKPEIINHKKSCVPGFDPAQFLVAKSQHVECKFLSCDVVENEMEKLKLHISGTHLPVEEKEKCPLCSNFENSGGSRANLLDHIAVKHHSLKYKCAACPPGQAIFNSNDNLRIHFKIKHYDMKYRCLQCKATFKLRRRLIDHVKNIHEGKKMEHATCHYCGKKMKNNQVLCGHIKVYHSDDVNIPCNICGLVFQDQIKLHHHRVGHYRQTKNAKQKCPECGNLVTNLLNHKIKFHSDSGPVQCFFCDEKYEQLFSFHKHLKRIHKKNYSFKRIYERIESERE